MIASSVGGLALLVHLVAVAVLTGLGWVVHGVVYPAFALVGDAEWDAYHRAHSRAITLVVGPPWLVQGVSAAVLLATRPVSTAGVLVLVALAAATVVLTVVGAVPLHERLGRGRRAPDLTRLRRVDAVRSVAWSASTVLGAVLVAAA